MTTATIIKHIFRDPNLPGSWGLDNLEVSAVSIRFTVNGFNFSGRISIMLSDDRLNVSFIDNDGAILSSMPNVHLPGLANRIDKYVEFCPNYEERIIQEYQPI